MFKKLFAIGLLLGSTASFGLEGTVGYLSGEGCSGRVQLEKTGHDRYELVAFTEAVVTAYDRETNLKNCVIDWELDLPWNMKLDQLTVKAFGDFEMEGRANVRAKVEHITGQVSTLAPGRWSSSDYDFDNFTLIETVTNSQLRPSDRSCGASIDMYTQFSLTASSRSEGSFAEVTLRRVEGDVGTRSVSLCEFIIRRC